MTCNACGEKPKDTAKYFTKAVIEIDNPETLILLRKVSIPASMGTEEQVPASIGKYKNVILYYEANKHTYIYSSDGIPTLLEVDIPQELWDRIQALEEGLDDEEETREIEDARLQQEIDDLKNSPDVVDIVATYADLQAYDTSSLGDKDVIRVLADETHDDESSYYRWSTSTQTWTFIGATGPYYTKSETDSLIDGINVPFVGTDGMTAGTKGMVPAPATEDLGKVLGANGDWIYGGITVLSENDYNWNSTSGSTIEPHNSVALWLLEPGLYEVPSGISAYITRSSSGGSGTSPIVATPAVYFVSTNGAFDYLIIRFLIESTAGLPRKFFRAYNVSSYGAWLEEQPFSKPVDDLNHNSNGVDFPLSAKQGFVLNNKITNLSIEVEDLAIRGAGAPTTATEGKVGTLYEDTTNGKLYQCTSIASSTYVWEEVGGGGLVTLSYGSSTWQDFIDAYNKGKIVYCRASSNADPSSGAQTRMAFMAYVSNPTNPTNVEFQYVRSVSNKSISSQCDQVFVYKLTNTGAWSVETRNMATTIAAGTGLTGTYSNGTLTLSITNPQSTINSTDWSNLWQ